MEKFKEHKLVMIPTDGYAPLALGENGLLVFDNYANSSNKNKNDFFINQHLYIISDEEINKGDWFIDMKDDSVIKSLGKNKGGFIIIDKENRIVCDKSYCKKIISTTDNSLVTRHFSTNANFSESTISIEGLQDILLETKLPQIPKTFIEYFVKERYKDDAIINQLVMVEYEDYCESCENIPSNVNECCGQPNHTLKVNKDNTINIKF